MPSTRRLLAAAALAGLAGVAGAAPVDGDSLAVDPHELAVRWTLASLSPRELPAADPQPLPPVRLGALPPAGAPDPAGYALMGLLLLGAGLAAKRLGATRARGRRRG